MIASPCTVLLAFVCAFGTRGGRPQTSVITTVSLPFQNDPCAGPTAFDKFCHASGRGHEDLLGSLTASEEFPGALQRFPTEKSGE